ncbi:MAG: rhodanese-like domain-containing protein [Brumimicrobium sp.]|nr:rhodanese-like domain-containing protein [Brumimicrobium sp.]
MIKEITPVELKKWMDEKRDFQLVDVRESDELAIASIGGLHIPLNTVPINVQKIDKNKDVVIYCRSGKRSANAITYLMNSSGYDNLYNLKGGILAWSDEIDNTIQKY